MTLGEHIREVRERAGMTQAELGKKVGVSGVAIMRYEKGSRQPRFEQLEAIAAALEVPVTALMGYVFTGRVDGKDIYEIPRDVIDIVIDEEKPTPVSEDGLSAEQLELINLFESAPPVLRAAALAVLRSAEGRDKVPGGASKAE